jgi:hypothetical protein
VETSRARVWSGGGGRSARAPTTVTARARRRRLPPQRACYRRPPGDGLIYGPAARPRRAERSRPCVFFFSWGGKRGCTHALRSAGVTCACPSGVSSCLLPGLRRRTDPGGGWPDRRAMPRRRRASRRRPPCPTCRAS